MNKKSKLGRFVALLVAMVMMAAMFPAMNVSAQETFDLGEFNYPHDWAPRWNADGVQDESYPLPWETVVSATQLVVELSTAPGGTVELVMQSDGNGWWGQTAVYSPEEDDYDGRTIVIDLADVAGWNDFVSVDTPGRFGLSFVGDIVVSAHLVLGAPAAVTAAVTGQNVLRLVTDSTTYTLNGATGTLEVAPINVDGRTLIPFRFIGETMGAVVTHTPATATTPLIAHFSLGNVNLDITMGVDIIHNGTNIGTPDIINDRTLVPVRVAEMMGAQVEWEPVARAVYVTFGEEEAPVTLPIIPEPIAEDPVEEEPADEPEDVSDEEEEEEEPVAEEAAPAADADTPPTGNVLRGEQLNAAGHGSVQFDINVTAGQQYTISAWVRNAAGRDNVMFQWSHYPANINGLCCGDRDCDGVPSASGVWVFHEITFEVPASNNSMLQIVPSAGAAGDVFYLADVTITSPGGVSTTIPLNAIRRHWDDSSFAVSIVPAP
ncbi:MAG: copper amine oxidase N-terminal domain-containing protein [Defluviitaleaceae bacterium]|nr:copper amine oxidase N-terminal domain-containing protein [Defluviitaleaceae bacterium]